MPKGISVPHRRALCKNPWADWTGSGGAAAEPEQCCPGDNCCAGRHRALALPQHPRHSHTAAATPATAICSAWITVISQTSWHCTDLKKKKKVIKKNRSHAPESQRLVSKSHLLAFIFLLCIFKNLSCDINLTSGQTDKVELWAAVFYLLFKINLPSPPF